MRCMTAALCCLPAVSVAASDDPKEFERLLAKVRSEPMVFIVVTGEPNACGRGCSEWIAGQGQFDESAAQRFREFLAVWATTCRSSSTRMAACCAKRCRSD
jgi:hypothetical protein